MKLDDYLSIENIAKINTIEQSFFSQNTGESANNCNCNECQNMCRRCACLGTPIDILKLCEAGYADRLSMTKWMVGYNWGAVVNGAPVGPIDMMQATIRPDGSCNFFDKATGKCELHDLGLKPTEGVWSSCKKDVGNGKPTLPLTLAVALTWQSSHNLPVWLKIMRYTKSYDKK